MHSELYLYTYVLCLGHDICIHSVRQTNMSVFICALITGYLQWWGSCGLLPVKFIVQFLSHSGSSIKVCEWLPDYCDGSWEMQDGVGSKTQSWLPKPLYSDDQQKQERNENWWFSKELCPFCQKLSERISHVPQSVELGLQNKSQLKNLINDHLLIGLKMLCFENYI